MAEKIITVENDLTIDTVNGLKKDFSSTGPGRKALVLDIGHVNNIDVCGIQLLISLHKSAETAGGQLKLVNAPPLLQESMEAMGLDPALFG